MAEATITYFPVGNGDMTHIRLTDRTDIVIDCNIRVCDDDDPCYDVHDHLLRRVRKAGDIPYINAFILTHLDLDHCRGFDTAFYLGGPSKYSKADKDSRRIRINELWFTPRIFSDLEKKLSPDAKAFRKEAKRRMELYKSGDDTRNDPGNRLRIIGSTDSDDLEGLKDIVYIPGKVARDIDGSTKDNFSFFIHAPVKADTDSEDSERNNTSIVLQARFNIDGVKDACLAIFGGDADYRVWDRIVTVSDDETFAWHLLLAPHHCSWTFFNDPGESDAQKKSLELLDKGRKGACVIASCKPIKDDDDNPPNYAARKIYVEKVGEKRFLVTSETPSEDDPRPITFRLTAKGPARNEFDSVASAVSASAATSRAAGSPRRYG